MEEKNQINFTLAEAALLRSCTLCPRNCAADRFSSKLGYCKSGTGFEISSICIHKGEEPVISGQKGICNIFFPHCNLQCTFCQNHEISRNKGEIIARSYSFDKLIGKICDVLDETENIVGFVSPSHYVPQMMAIIRGLRSKGRNPVFVYNTNGYDKVETLQMLEGYIDIYLPDFKYMDAALAKEYSQATDYPEIAMTAIKEMYRQKGSTLIVNDNGIAESGIIIRHLVLPGGEDQSIDVLKFIADEISVKLHISLMAQYFPTQFVKDHPHLHRNLSIVEYTKVTQAFHKLGFYKGWVQELESHSTFRPNFSDDQPFEV